VIVSFSQNVVAKAATRRRSNGLNPVVSIAASVAGGKARRPAALLMLTMF